MKGKVIWFNKKKGFGFISPEDKSKDIFVHYSGIIDEEDYKVLEKGQAVEFEITENDKGRTAVNTKVLEQVVQK